MKRKGSMEGKRIHWKLFLFFAAVFLITAGGHFYYQDGFHKYLITDQIFEGNGPFHEQLYMPAPGGKKTASFPVGTSVWMMPLYLLGRGAYLIYAAVNEIEVIRNHMFFSSLFVMFLNPIAVAALAALFFKTARRLDFSPRGAFLGTLLFAFTTLIWPYSKFCFSEPQAALFLLAAFYVLLGLRNGFSLLKLVLAGVFFGFAMITKYEIVFLLPAFAIYAYYLIRNCGLRAKLHALLALFLVGDVFAFIILAWNYVRFENIFIFGRYDYFLQFLPRIVMLGLITSVLLLISSLLFRRSQKVRDAVRTRLSFFWALPVVVFFFLWIHEPKTIGYAYRALLAPGKSLFVFSPVLVLSLFGFRDFFRMHRAEALLVAGLLLTFLLGVRSETVWGWGPRYYVTLLPFLFLPVMAFLKHGLKTQMMRGISYGIITVSLLVQMIAVAVNYQDSFNWIDRLVAYYTQIPITNYDLEARLVFSRFLYDPEYAPIPAQYHVLSSILTNHRPSDDRMLTKPGVRAPQDWSIDFWWLYLRQHKFSFALIYGIVSVLSAAALFFFIMCLIDVKKMNGASG